MGAWMKSTTTGKFYLTTEFDVVENVPQGEASDISAVLGFKAAQVDGTAIKREIARTTVRRERLVADIAARVQDGLTGGVTVTLDPDAIAAAVEGRLADEFAAVDPEAVAVKVREGLAADLAEQLSTDLDSMAAYLRATIPADVLALLAQRIGTAE